MADPIKYWSESGKLVTDSASGKLCTSCCIGGIATLEGSSARICLYDDDLNFQSYSFTLAGSNLRYINNLIYYMYTSSVFQYDTAFTLLNTYAAGGTVSDYFVDTDNNRIYTTCEGVGVGPTKVFNLTTGALINTGAFGGYTISVSNSLSGGTTSYKVIIGYGSRVSCYDEDFNFIYMTPYPGIIADIAVRIGPYRATDEDWSFYYCGKKLFAPYEYNSGRCYVSDGAVVWKDSSSDAATSFTFEKKIGIITNEYIYGNNLLKRKSVSSGGSMSSFCGDSMRAASKISETKFCSIRGSDYRISVINTACSLLDSRYGYYGNAMEIFANAASDS